MDLTKLKADIECGKEQRFYSSDEWKRVRASVIKLDNHQCTNCGMIFLDDSDAIVHHVKQLKQAPELGLTIMHDGERQLVTVCRNCHEMIHGALKRCESRKKPLTEERWD